MPNKSEFNRKAVQMQVFFEEEAKRIAEETEFVQRKSKMDGVCFSQTLIMGYLENAEASLNDLAQVSAELGVTMSAEGLHSRINERAVAFLERLTQTGLCAFQEQVRMPENLLQPFTKVNLVDRTVVKLPDFLAEHFRGTKVQGGTSTMKVQLSYDYLCGEMNAIEIEAGRSPDQKSNLPRQFATVDSLTLLDLGYFDQNTFQWIAEQGGYFISRLQSQVGLYEGFDDTKAFDLLTFLQQAPQGCGEKTLLMGSKTRLPVRMVFVSLPQEVVAERRRKAQATARRRGQTCSQRSLDLLAWALFVTNVPDTCLTPEQVAFVYRLRWQIELVFKLWKSQAKIKVIGQWRVERVLCQFYARLLGVILFQWMSSPYRFLTAGELSLPKAFRILKRHIGRFLDAIADHWLAIPAILEKIVGDFRRYALKNKRQKSPSTWQLLLQQMA